MTSRFLNAATKNAFCPEMKNAGKRASGPIHASVIKIANAQYPNAGDEQLYRPRGNST